MSAWRSGAAAAGRPARVRRRGGFPYVRGRLKSGPRLPAARRSSRVQPAPVRRADLGLRDPVVPSPPCADPCRVALAAARRIEGGSSVRGQIQRRQPPSPPRCRRRAASASSSGFLPCAASFPPSGVPSTRSRAGSERHGAALAGRCYASTSGEYRADCRISGISGKPEPELSGTRNVGY